MKNIWYIGTIALAITLTSCGGEGGDDSKDGKESTSEEASGSGGSYDCDNPNALYSVAWKDSTIDFDLQSTYANINKTVGSYRVIYTNFDATNDKDFADLEGDQVKIGIMVFDPADGEFAPGKYTWKGNEDGKNRIAVTVNTADGDVYCNYAGMEDKSYVQVTSITDSKICGTAKIVGQNGFKIDGSFNAEHKDL